MPDYQFIVDLDNGVKARTGWIQDPKNVDMVLGQLPSPVYGVAASTGRIEDSGKGKVILLSDAVLKVYKKYIVLKQTIGDCVSQGAAKAVDTLACVQIAAGKREVFKNVSATEIIYAGSRVEISQGRFGRGDGSTGAAGARFCNRYGTLVRGVYGQLDLSKYSGSLARKLGMPNVGVPDALEPTIAEHIVNTVSLVLTYEEARDALANGYPVTIASNRGFKTTRDRDGCLAPYGSWAHQMCLTGIIDDPRRPRVVCENSWGGDRDQPGGWVSGPRTFEAGGRTITIPPGSFCIDAEVLQRDILRVRDSFAYSSFVGFPLQPDILDYDFLGGS